MHTAWFVTGTDTEIGKTHACCALLHALRRKSISAIGMKPIAAGTDDRGRNDDVDRLRASSSALAPPELVNPYLFAPAIAPHVAAQEAGVRIDLDTIRSAYRRLTPLADAVVVEGVGGFCVPLDDHCDTADLAVVLGLPVILVIGIKLGCLNHALLTAEAIAARGLKLSGWIANMIDPTMSRPDASIDALRARLGAPLLGILPWGESPQQASLRLVLPL